jgi:tRNA(Ile)-lysidine synthase
MRDWCADHGVRWLLTAHHADDQAETLLLRLARGAGLGGLAGIRPRRDLGRGVTLLRPLLEARRADLARVVAGAGLVALDDPANCDPRYDRTAARALLAATGWLAADRIAAAAAHLADAEAALDWAADAAWRSAVVTPSAIALDIADLPPELQRRVLLRAFAALGAAEPDGPALDRLRAKLGGGGTATLGGVQAKGGATWRLCRAPPHKR